MLPITPSPQHNFHFAGTILEKGHPTVWMAENFLLIETKAPTERGAKINAVEQKTESA